ncbi:MAG: hypothetical protein ACJAV2_003449 [Myxococcota bacterium]
MERVDVQNAVDLSEGVCREWTPDDTLAARTHTGCVLTVQPTPSDTAAWSCDGVVGGT